MGEGRREEDIGSGGRRIEAEVVHILHAEAGADESRSRRVEEDHRRIEAEEGHNLHGEELEIRSRLGERRIEVEAEEGSCILQVRHNHHRRRRSLRRIEVEAGRWEEDSCCYRIRILLRRAGWSRGSLGQGIRTWLWLGLIGSIESE